MAISELQDATHIVSTWLQEQQTKDQLKIMTSGSVDDGKSSLLGRILWELGQFTIEQEALLDAKAPDFSQIFDGLAAEREQGITIDVAYRYFTSKKRHFILMDAPGHEQYTCNMVTAASRADAAIIMLDAKKGVSIQTKRHLLVLSLLKVPAIIFAINKMDLVNYSEAVFTELVAQCQALTDNLKITNIKFIPVSAVVGDNITTISSKMPWYKGPALINLLENINVQVLGVQYPILGVQQVLRDQDGLRWYAGTLLGGALHFGDIIKHGVSNHTSQIASVIGGFQNITTAYPKDAIAINLTSELDVSSGEIFTHPEDSSLASSDTFEANLVWLGQERGLVGRRYEFRLLNQWRMAVLTKVKHKINPATYQPEPVRELKLNDLVVCQFKLTQPIIFKAFQESRALGNFILVDQYTKMTVACGMILFSLYRASNIIAPTWQVTRHLRETAYQQTSRVIFLTGLSGSGKSTIANLLEKQLFAQGHKTYILDGDCLRQGLNSDLGFSDADRVENVRRAGEVAKILFDAGLVVIVALIAPFQQDRDWLRAQFPKENYLEIYLSTELSVCQARDPKGLYKKVQSGKLPNMSGMSSNYEIPLNPDLIIDTAKINVEDAVSRIMSMWIASA